MIVYGSRPTEVSTASLVTDLRALAERTDHDGIVEALITAGQLESGVVDAWCPDTDRDDPRIAPIRAMTVGFGRAVVASSTGRRPRPVAVDPGPVPERVSVSVPEGYAWYAAFPETWADAARSFARALGPDEALVVGLRTIGTSLSAVVHAALEAEGWRVRSLTVRPRGHPFERTVTFDGGLAGRMRAPWVLVVDEGPGLSGSSLTGTAAAIAALGVPDDRIVLFPSWCPDGEALVSETARRRWSRHRKVVGHGRAVVERVTSPFGAQIDDWSAGRWREAHGTWPAVQPQHEREKWLVDGRFLVKFAGLGRWGRAGFDRAQRLADAGVGPAVHAFSGGFVVHERVAGAPVDRVSSGLIDAVCGRLALAAEMPTERAVPVDALHAMIATNLSEAGLPVPRTADVERLGDAGTVAIDGRLAIHEWLATPTGFVKTDGVDHCADHFFPGFQDLAWDVAGAAIELGGEVRDAILSRLGDRALARRVPFYEVAYCAFRLGYATMAREAVIGAEQTRWATELARVTAAARAAVVRFDP